MSKRLTPSTDFEVFAKASNRTLRRFIERYKDSTDENELYVVQVMRDTLEDRKQKCIRGRSIRMQAMNKARGRNLNSEWRREIAMEAGMGLGIDAYNDVMGY